MKHPAAFFSILIFYLFILIIPGCRSSEKTICFYVFSDTHLLDTSDNRYLVIDSMITEANNLYGKELPENYSYLKKERPKGLLVCGDLTDGATASQWEKFSKLFGLQGENHLKMPVYESYGNHDGDTSGLVRSALRTRNQRRKGLTHLSENGLHYSFDWGNYHFISLGSYPADGWDSTCAWCHYFKKTFREPQLSLSFLKEDLAEYIKKDKKIILYFHYGWDSFSKLWWTENEQEKFYEVIKNYKVAAIFTGHNHAAGYLKWKGIDVYSAGSPQSGLQTGSFLYVQAGKDSLYVMERKLNGWGSHIYKKKID